MAAVIAGVIILAVVLGTYHLSLGGSWWESLRGFGFGLLAYLAFGVMVLSVVVASIFLWPYGSSILIILIVAVPGVLFVGGAEVASASVLARWLAPRRAGALGSPAAAVSVGLGATAAGLASAAAYVAILYLAIAVNLIADFSYEQHPLTTLSLPVLIGTAIGVGVMCIVIGGLSAMSSYGNHSLSGR